MELGDALAWLDRHGPIDSSGVAPGPAGSERTRALLDLIGSPEASMPVVVVSGRHGKTAEKVSLACKLQYSSQF
jgi:folylpolyglutamate synthase/dihydropteroate synthase